MMRAVVCSALSPDLSGLACQDDWPEPLPPGPGEVLVATSHASLNFPDFLMLQGGYQFKPDLPFIPGTEGTGTVIAAGPGAEAMVGQAVMLGARSGLMAERITLPTRGLRPVPEGLTMAEAAAFTVGALTAWVGLVERGRLQAGERVLVTGAGGGMGRAAVQLAVHLGAQVVAVASTAARLELAKAAGAHELILIDRENPVIPMKDIDLVFDPVAGSLVLPLVKCLRRGGRYAIIGFVGGRGDSVPLNRLLLKEIALIGVRAGEQGRQDPAAGARHIREIDARAVHMKPHIGLEVPLSDVRSAFAAMGAGQIEGKCVIRVS
ncbi:zinc-binding dehydrogenase [Sandarakinorhabdus sp.]|uniref:zinc-binding dehydrogenase n=1 Tax=Sandarakinorhabdus sp. TaxID=1916663 RepID=UPI00286E8A4E|nr:zinc-binding dehydrogenase [Sandarakinorhabdus sp.]